MFITLGRGQNLVNVVCERPLTLFDNHICADFKDEEGKKHNEVIVTGWGKKRKCKFCEELDPTAKAFSDVLMRVKLPITNSIPGCSAYNSDSTQICAGGIEGPPNSK